MTALNMGLGLIGSFLLGSIPSAYLLVRVRRNQDIRQTGSGNAGTMNVRALMGWKAAVAVLVCDSLKGVGAVYLCRLLNINPDLGLAMAVAGHIYSPWLGFHGGKGLATALGGAVANGEWLILIVFGLVWLLCYNIIWPKKTDQANLAGALGVAVYGLVNGWQWGLVLMAVLISCKHWQVIKSDVSD